MTPLPTPAAIAMKPSSASRPSISEYAGMIAMLRRTVLRDLEASTPVTECGYMNSAIAEPRPSVAYVHFLVSGTVSDPALASLKCCAAESKMCPKPPSRIGM